MHELDSTGSAVRIEGVCFSGWRLGLIVSIRARGVVDGQADDGPVPKGELVGEPLSDRLEESRGGLIGSQDHDGDHRGDRRRADVARRCVRDPEACHREEARVVQ